MWTFGNLLLKDIIQTQPTLSVQSVGVFMADFDCFDFVVRSFAALDLTGVFRRFFGVDVAFATFDGDLGIKWCQLIMLMMWMRTLTALAS